MIKYSITSVSEYISCIEKISEKNNLWFRGVPSSEHLPVPGVIWKGLLQHEGDLEHSFLEAYKSYTNNAVLNSWEIFSLMQHHGLPTRLLDWTESALVALYFSLSSDYGSKQSSTVWAMNPFSLNHLSLKKRRLFCPAVMNNRIVTSSDPINLDNYLPPNLKGEPNMHIPQLPIAIKANNYSRRISAQKGCFTVHGTNKSPINEIMDKEFMMIKVCSKPDSRKRMLNVLSDLGIDEESIYQDLDSLCRKLAKEWVK